MATKNFRIVRGRTFTIIADFLRQDGSPISLNDFTDAYAYFSDASGNTVAASGSLVSADRGRVQYPFPRVTSLQFGVTDDQNIELQCNHGTTTEKNLLQAIISVDETLNP